MQVQVLEFRETLSKSKPSQNSVLRDTFLTDFHNGVHTEEQLYWMLLHPERRESSVVPKLQANSLIPPRQYFLNHFERCYYELGAGPPVFRYIL